MAKQPKKSSKKSTHTDRRTRRYLDTRAYHRIDRASSYSPDQTFSDLTLPEPAPEEIHQRSKYRIGYANKVYNFHLMNWPEKRMAEALGVTSRQFDQWKKIYPEFAAACLLGKEEVLGRAAKAIQQRAVGFRVQSEKVFCTREGQIKRAKTWTYYPPDVTAAQYLLNNLDPENWSSTSRHELSGPGGTPLGSEEESPRERIARRLTSLAQRSITHSDQQDPST